MDFQWSPEEERFREQVQQVLRKELPADWLQTVGDDAAGAVPSYESSVLRLFAAELNPALVQLGMEALGLWSEPKESSPLNVLRGKVQKLYRGKRAITIGAGTVEIQRNTIVMRGLGLPRG